MEIIKRILNFFRPEKKNLRNESEFDMPFEEAKRQYDQAFIDRQKSSYEEISEKLFKPRTQLFRNQQLPGKIYNIGKSRFRIKNKIGAVGEKLKYHIDILT